MPNLPISGLPAIGTPALTDLFAEVQPALGGTTYKATFQQLYNLFNTNQPSLSPYIVGATKSDYTTIQAAMNQAHTDGASSTNQITIYIKDGTYTENITWYDGINLYAFSDIPIQSLNFIPPVKIVGNVTFHSSAVRTNANGIWFAPTSGNVIDSTATSGAINIFTNCRITPVSNSVFCFNAGQGSIYCRNTQLINQTASGTGQLCHAAVGNSVGMWLENCNTILTQDSPISSGDGVIAITVTGGTFQYCFDVTSISQFGLIGKNSTFGNASNSVDMITSGVSTADLISFQYCQILCAANKNIVNSGNSANHVDFADCIFGANTTGSPVAGVTSIVGSSSNFVNCIVYNGVSDSPTMYLKNKLILTGYAGSDAITAQAGAHTTDATVTTLASVLVNELESITLKGTITAAQSDHTNAIGGDYTITARRASGGNVTIVGVAICNINSSSAATFTADVNTGTQTVRIRVTGISAQTYNWVTTYTYQKVLTNS